MFCKSCGQQIADGAGFCQFCGSPQNDAAPAAAAAPAPAVPAPGAGYQQAAPARPAGPSPLANLFAGTATGVPTGGISGWVINLIGGDRGKTAKLLWRMLTVIGALLLVIHTFGLFFGKVLKFEALTLSLKYSLKDCIKMGALSESGSTVFTLIVEIVLTLAVLALIALAVMKFMLRDIPGILQMTGFAFGAVTIGKIMLMIWYFIMTSDADTEGAGGMVDYGMSFALIWSMLICGAFAFLFLMLAKEYAQYRETPAIPVPAGNVPGAAPAAYQPAAPAPAQAYQQPQAPVQPQAYQQPQAPVQPQAYQQPQAPIQPQAYQQPQAPVQPQPYQQPQAPVQPQNPQYPPYQ
ncbi:MAG: zinc ribbon domain-containing protein [Oscillospiraceae bacterium]|nr:zinc ribbon domain-containing protein [Oscillospiraceae bacterium]